MDEDQQSAFSIFSEAFGYRVETERQARGLTKEDLAARAGMAARYLWRVEAGRQNITLKNLLALAQALEMTMSELLAGVEAIADDPPPKPQKKPRGRKAAVR